MLPCVPFVKKLLFAPLPEDSTEAGRKIRRTGGILTIVRLWELSLLTIVLSGLGKFPGKELPNEATNHDDRTKAIMECSLTPNTRN